MPAVSSASARSPINGASLWEFAGRSGSSLDAILPPEKTAKWRLHPPEVSQRGMLVPVLSLRLARVDGNLAQSSEGRRASSWHRSSLSRRCLAGRTLVFIFNPPLAVRQHRCLNRCFSAPQQNVLRRRRLRADMPGKFKAGGESPPRYSDFSVHWKFPDAQERDPLIRKDGWIGVLRNARQWNRASWPVVDRCLHRPRIAHCPAQSIAVQVPSATKSPVTLRRHAGRPLEEHQRPVPWGHLTGGLARPGERSR